MFGLKTGQKLLFVFIFSVLLMHRLSTIIIIAVLLLQVIHFSPEAIAGFIAMVGILSIGAQVQAFSFRW